MVLAYDIRDRFQFEYTTLTRIRAEGILSSTLSDADTRALIRVMSKLINNVTGQWFWPVESKERISGDGFPILTHPSQIPLLEVRGLTVDYSTGQSQYSPTTYAVGNRDIELSGYEYAEFGTFYTSKRSKFPKTRPLNVIIDGTFGWLENRPFVSSPFDNVAKYQSTFSAPLANAATTVTVADGSGFRVRDVVIIRSGAAADTYAGHAILTAVAGNVLTFDALNLNTSSVASGTIITYGQVPELVDRACAILVITFKDKVGTQSSSQAGLQSRILRERTDNYEYQLQNDTSLTSTSNTTGNTEVDRILANFHAPPYIGAV